MTGYTCLHVDLLKIVLSYIYILVLRLETLNEKNIGMYSCHQTVSIEIKNVVKGYVCRELKNILYLLDDDNKCEILPNFFSIQILVCMHYSNQKKDHMPTQIFIVVVQNSSLKFLWENRLFGAVNTKFIVCLQKHL